jgi:hypothetical protein
MARALMLVLGFVRIVVVSFAAGAARRQANFSEMSNFAQTSRSRGHLLARLKPGRVAFVLSFPPAGPTAAQRNRCPAAGPDAEVSCKEGNVDTTTLLIIIVIVLLLGGGGWYGRGRWY